AFTIHLSLLGEAGFTRLAEINHAKAVQLAEKIATLKGFEILPDAFYNEFAVKLPKPAADVVETLVDNKILGGVPAARLFPREAALNDVLLLTATETNSEGDMDALVAALKEVL